MAYVKKSDCGSEVPMLRKNKQARNFGGNPVPPKFASSARIYRATKPPLNRGIIIEKSK